MFADVFGNLTEEQKDKIRQRIKDARKYAYQNATTYGLDSSYQGYYGDEKLTLNLVPQKLRQDELTDWLFVFQLPGADVYSYSLQKWHKTDSDMWLMTALSKAEKNSTEVEKLLEKAAKFNRDSPAFPTVAFHQARLMIDSDKRAEARKLLDSILNSTLNLPISTRNLFAKQRFAVAEDFSEFLRFGLRKPFAFCLDYYRCGSIDEIVQQRKGDWKDFAEEGQTKEEYEHEVEGEFENERLWENRFIFGEEMTEVFNYHLPLQLFFEATQSSELPDYLRKELILTTWTRAFLLENSEIENKAAPELIKQFPELKTLFEPYLQAKTLTEKRRAGLYFLLKVHTVSPYVVSEIGKTPNLSNSEIDYYFSAFWWCVEHIKYDGNGNRITPTAVPEPSFLTIDQRENGHREYEKLKAIGDAPKYFAEEVFNWAQAAPKDARMPEALFIVSRANGPTRYNCGNNDELSFKASSLLRKRYPKSEWTEKLDEGEDQN
jgi:hypothetical protein